MITEVDGTATDTTRRPRRRSIGGHQPGDKVSVNYQRDGAPRTVTVTLGSKAAD